MITVRIRFEKTGEAAYISLLDLQRVFHRILKRSGLPVYYTQGFNPHIYLSFACPLSLGQESLCECCEVKTEAEDPQLDTWCDVLQPYMPRGIKVLSAQQAQNKVAEIDHASYLVTLPASAAAALDAYNAAENAMVVKKTKRGQKELDLKTLSRMLNMNRQGSSCSLTWCCPAAPAKHRTITPLCCWAICSSSTTSRPGCAACCARSFTQKTTKNFVNLPKSPCKICHGMLLYLSVSAAEPSAG